MQTVHEYNHPHTAIKEVSTPMTPFKGSFLGLTALAAAAGLGHLFLENRMPVQGVVKGPPGVEYAEEATPYFGIAMLAFAGLLCHFACSDNYLTRRHGAVTALIFSLANLGRRLSLGQHDWWSIRYALAFDLLFAGLSLFAFLNRFNVPIGPGKAPHYVAFTTAPQAEKEKAG
jgi:hypothetical protein